MEFDLSKSYCYYFNEICKIPHGSGNEKALSDWMVAFAVDHGLDYIQDKLWNVVIYKQASPGYEDHPGVLIQAHMDMVCEKVSGCTHNFETDPLDLYVEGDHLRARGTTLGADDGMGCAYMLAILADDTLKHPYLECCFTVQEEVGLIGAQALKPDYFKARQMINLDGAGEIKTYMGMAGGERTTLTKPLTWEENHLSSYKLTVDGLLGGHPAGMIDKERGNASKLLARVLCTLERSGICVRLADFNGGEKSNAITPCAIAIFSSDADAAQLDAIISKCGQDLAEEYELSDPDVKVTLTAVAPVPRVMSQRDGSDLLHLIYLLPFGLKARNMNVDGFPPVASVNVGSILVHDSEAVICVPARSSTDSMVSELKEQITLLGELYGASASYSGYYPGWKYEANSHIREKIKEVFFDLYQKPINCLIGHGGNECGVFKKMFPDMDIITSGAIYGNIHTTDEFLDLASFDRAWVLLTKLIAAL